MQFREGQLIIYEGSNGYELGKIKKIKDNKSAWVWYHGGDTAALTPFDKIKPLINAYCLEEIISKQEKTMNVTIEINEERLAAESVRRITDEIIRRMTRNYNAALEKILKEEENEENNTRGIY